MSNKIKIALLLAVLLFGLCISGAFGMATKGPENVNAQNKGKRGIIINWDSASLHWDIFKNRQVSGTDRQLLKQLLEDIVDEHAKAEVDTVVWCMFSDFRSYIPSKVAHSNWDALPKLKESGLDFHKILLERSRQRNIRFIAGLRMNDRHEGVVRKFRDEHPQWLLKDMPETNPGLDYVYDGVRQAMLTVIEEILDAYDVDGLELDYMRWCHMFSPGQGSKNAHILTEFNKKIRKLLDEAAKRRGRKRLVLGVRVPQNIAGCDYLGFDVETWIKTGLVDWVVPTDFLYTDYNAKIADFVKLAKGTDCKIYAGIHPTFAWGIHHPLMTPANYRAAAKYFFAAGADGLSPYNYVFHWDKRRSAGKPGPGYMWPAAMGYLRQIRDPEQVNTGDRHYLFYPIFNRKTPWTPPSGFYNDDSIELNPSGQLQGTQSFHMAEDFSDPDLRATMQFKAVGLAESENLEIQINGAAVPKGFITRIFEEKGLTEADGRYDTKVVPPFYYYWIDLNWGKVPIINGDNKLTVRLVSTKAENHREVLIDELEVYVYVRK